MSDTELRHTWSYMIPDARTSIHTAVTFADGQMRLRNIEHSARPRVWDTE